MKTYDVIWIGTGQATGTVVPQLKAWGKSVAVIEEDRAGGTCVNWGCTPTKALVAAAKVAHVVRTAGDLRHPGPGLFGGFSRGYGPDEHAQNGGIGRLRSLAQDLGRFLPGPRRVRRSP